MIKVLFYITTLSGGGAEKVLCNLVNNMNYEEFDITVQTLYREDYKTYLNERVHYKSVFPCNKSIYTYLYRVETALGLLYKLHMKGDYDIECAYLECGETKVLASSNNKKAKKVAWVHCDQKVAFGNEYAKKTYKWYRKYDHIVCVSEQVQKSFLDLFGNDFNTSVVYNVVDSEEIIRKSKEELPQEVPEDELILVSVARLTGQKNLMRLVQSYKRLKDEGLLSKLWIIGEGEDRGKLEAFIKNNSLQNDIILWGFQSNPYPFILRGDLMVCSSDYEGFSTFVTESLILGKAVITTKCSGMDELLGKSEYGIITENSDEGFYTGLKDLLTHKDLRLPILEQNAKSRGAEFTTCSLVLKNEKFLKDLL